MNSLATELQDLKIEDLEYQLRKNINKAMPRQSKTLKAD